MPIYIYFCTKCEKEFKVFHSIKEKYETCMQATECIQSGSLKRMPSNFSLAIKNKSENGKVGNLVEKFIEDNKQDLKKEKEILRSREYKK
jgi:putative FmdB family regulatory protein